MAHELDPSLFQPAAVAAETQRFNDMLEKALAEVPTITELPPPVVREARREGRSIFGEIRRLAHGEARTIPGPAG